MIEVICQAALDKSDWKDRKRSKKKRNNFLVLVNQRDFVTEYPDILLNDTQRLCGDWLQITVKPGDRYLNANRQAGG